MNRRLHHHRHELSPDLADYIKDWRADAETLSYEEALQAVDVLLAELQSDTVPLADLQKHVVHGEVYLNHCEALLKVVEDNVVHLDPDSLQPVPASTDDDA